MNKQITVAVLGAGNRGRTSYSSLILKKQEDIKVVAVADIDPNKVEHMAKEHNIPAEMCFTSAETILEQPKLADMAFICTQDKQHYDHAIKALKKGYHLLLEKPISPSLKECKEIADTANALGLKVIVCHVLRYTPFYMKLKELLDSGVIGNVVTVYAEEDVGYWHQCHSFVRGNWRNSDETSPMILAKCCHDMDILLWLTGKKCLKVSSFGSTNHFKKECAPEGAAMRCFDCAPEVKAKCPFDCEKIYLDGARGVRNGFTRWPANVLNIDPTEENIVKALKEGPYGRCVYHCDNNVVDTQVVNMQLEDGVTVNFTMSAFSHTINRGIHIRGAKGELIGDMGANKIVVRIFGDDNNPTVINTNPGAVKLSKHGGGDEGIIDCIIKLFKDGVASKSISTIDQSVESHFVALAAEESRINGGQLVDMKDWYSRF